MQDTDVHLASCYPIKIKTAPGLWLSGTGSLPQGLARSNLESGHHHEG
jgi:hypothetical protein